MMNILSVMKCFELHQTLKSVKIKYCWILGHVGILGNERADKAAKPPQTTPETFVPLTDIFQAVNPLRLSVPADDTPNFTRFSTIKFDYKWKIIGLGKS
ncbi:hypothetical protein AVEN_47168-1 [Araneus ventricosus]|uniref:Uncharacterized protein n=1 Tax=Araneus ventricosus TaxID=182803 RepID=A0A4Y2MZZ8_ARAVE|nr:hypothetical protein AVEN_47168-1 [Araneus ventricosus]